MLHYDKLKNKPGTFRSITGLRLHQFVRLVAEFTAIYDQSRQPTDAKPRKRKLGGGRKGVLATPQDKLLFILFYFRHYPTQEVMGVLFGMRVPSGQTPQACYWVHTLTPLLRATLKHELCLPEREPAELEEVMKNCKGLQFVIDGTERPVRRPADKTRQKQDYSGKKKRHTKKNIVIIDKKTGKIIGLGKTQAGSMHDKKCADEEKIQWPEGSELDKDTGFQGYEPKGVKTRQPKKKPRGGELTEDEKKANKQKSSERIIVEHMIGGAKKYRIVADVFRGVKEGFVDSVMELACALHNWWLKRVPQPA